MQRRRAFSLIELLVAVTLSALVILLAAACFRTVSRVFAQVNRLADENAALRSGVLLSLVDCDYWTSYGDDRPPYAKGVTRVPRRDATDPAKRLFAPVVHAYRAGSLPDWEQADPATPDGDTYVDPATGLTRLKAINPHGMLAHHPAAWARCSYTASEPYVFHWSYYCQPSDLSQAAWCHAFATSYRAHDQTLNDDFSYPAYPVTNMYGRVNQGGARNDYNLTERDLRAGCFIGQNRRWLGDYGLVEATTMDDPRLCNRFWRLIQASITVDGAEESALTFDHVPGLTEAAHWAATQVNCRRPRQMLQTFQRLGHHGVAQYLPRGCPATFHDQHGDLPNHRARPIFGPRAVTSRPDLAWDECLWFNSVHGNVVALPLWGLKPWTYEAASGRNSLRPLPPGRQDGGLGLVFYGKTDNVLPLCYYGLDLVGSRDYGTVIGQLPRRYWSDAFYHRVTATTELTSQEQIYQWGPFLATATDLDLATNAQPGKFLGPMSMTGTVDWRFWAEGGYPLMINTFGMFPPTDVRAQPGLAARTQHVPLNLTDQERDNLDLAFQCRQRFGASNGFDWSKALSALDQTSKPPQAPTLHTYMTRFGGVFGGDLAAMVVQTESSGNPPVRLAFSALGSSYLGARQHWALQHIRNFNAQGNSWNPVSGDINQLLGWIKDSSDNTRTISTPAGDFYAQP